MIRAYPFSSILSSTGLLLTAWIILLCPLAASEPADDLMLPLQFRKLLPLHTKLGKARPGDWLTEHPEPGQTFRQYLRSKPVKVDEKRRVIYVQPLGEFSPTQKRIVEESAKFMGLYFQLPVKVREGLSLNLVPKTARRKSGFFGSEQILTTYVLFDILQPRMPKNGVVQIAFTASDLWPGEGWNYVFGQASLGARVGVWSLHRFGNPETSEDAYHLCLLRTIKTATHETGHMFSMNHCTLYECNMCGCNNLGESDRRPLEVCPHCLAKLCYATGADPARRFKDLIQFHKARGLKAEQEFCEKSLTAANDK